MIYTLGNYGEFRTKCHKVKDNDISTIIDVSVKMAGLIHDDYVLVPIPNHNGKAEYTRLMAEVISNHTGLQVCDCLTGNKRETLYSAKINGNKIDIRFKKHGRIPKKKILLIDNVIDTGRTYKTAEKALNRPCDILTISKTV